MLRVALIPFARMPTKPLSARTQAELAEKAALASQSPPRVREQQEEIIEELRTLDEAFEAQQLDEIEQITHEVHCSPPAAFRRPGDVDDAVEEQQRLRRRLDQLLQRERALQQSRRTLQTKFHNV